MKKLLFIAVLVPVVSSSVSGCVWSREYREVVVHKDSNGKITGYDYTESLDQRDLLPWKENFGKYLYNQ